MKKVIFVLMFILLSNVAFAVDPYTDNITWTPLNQSGDSNGISNMGLGDNIAIRSNIASSSLNHSGTLVRVTWLCGTTGGIWNASIPA